MGITKRDLLIEKNIHGAWVISAMAEGWNLTRQYYFYSKKEAIQKFLAEANEPA